MFNSTPQAPLLPAGLITPEQAACALNVSAETIRRWIRDGILQAVRVGPRNIRIEPAALATMVQRRESLTAP